MRYDALIPSRASSPFDRTAIATAAPQTAALIQLETARRLRLRAEQSATIVSGVVAAAVTSSTVLLGYWLGRRSR